MLVGLPTRDHLGTVAQVIRAVRACLHTFYPRLRVALLHVDHGSRDGTQELAFSTWNEDRGHSLRTNPYIASTTDSESDGDIVRMILAAADLLQARATAVVDAEAEPDGPSDLAAITSIVWEGSADLVAPVYARGMASGLLVTQLVSPVTRAVYARRLAEPLIPTFACSGRFAAHCTQAAWNTDPEQRETRYWVVAEALTGPFAVSQCALGQRRLHAGRPQPALPQIFSRVLTSMFSCMEAHAEIWLPRTQTDDVAFRGMLQATDDATAAGEAPRQARSFAQDIHNLADILRLILAPETMASIEAASDDPSGARYPDELWAVTVADFLAAFHYSVMRRDHITQALLPLYRARTSAFLQTHAGEPSTAVEAALESLALCFEHARPRIVQRWTKRGEVEHG